MEKSILKSIKKVVGVSPDYDVFDEDILMAINTSFSTLNQLGIGPEGGFSIEDETPTWSDYIGGDPNYNSIKTYIQLKTRLLFDPPANSIIKGAIDEQLKEIEWRLNVRRENDVWKSPTTTT